MKPKEIIKNFVENGFTSSELEKELYYNKELIAYLESFANIPRYSNEPSAYHELITENFSDKGSHLNILDIFEQILQEENINFEVNHTIKEDCDFILNATPSWIPNHISYVSKLYDDNKPKTKKQFKEILLESFRCIKKYPKWIQEPDWIIHEKPLIFVGQIDVSLLYHDTTYLYTFFNPYTKTYEYITQSM